MIEREDTQTRGFLFADIRGYTEYLERNGASASAELLARYRAIVRAAVAEHRGAEIRTEGDSFYVVLPSASSAVRCALSIIAAVDAENARQPTAAIHVGIGVHAGEAIDTEEGLVGSAVNIAARLAAIARPAEILVSETVRTLTRSVIKARFVARGRHRLKGVAEPQQVFAAVPAGTLPATVRFRGLRQPLASTAVIVAVLVVVALGYATVSGGSAGQSPSPPPVGPTASPTLAAELTASPSATATLLTANPSPSGSGGPTVIFIDPNARLNPVPGALRLLTVGSYRWASFQPVLVFQIEPTWTDRAWYPNVASSDFTELLGLRPGVDTFWDYHMGINAGMVRLSFVRLQTVLGNPCDPGDTSSYKVLGGQPSDVINWLSTHRFLAATNRQPASIAGWIGISIDVTVAGDPGKVCAGLSVPHQGVAHLFKTTHTAPGYSGIYDLHDGEEARFTVLDIGADVPLVFVAATRVSEFQTLTPRSTDLLNTVTVGTSL